MSREDKACEVMTATDVEDARRSMKELLAEMAKIGETIGRPAAEVAAVRLSTGAAIDGLCDLALKGLARSSDAPHITAGMVIRWAGETLRIDGRTDSEKALAEAITDVANNAPNAAPQESEGAIPGQVASRPSCVPPAVAAPASALATTMRGAESSQSTIGAPSADKHGEALMEIDHALTALRQAKLALWKLSEALCAPSATATPITNREPAGYVAMLKDENAPGGFWYIGAYHAQSTAVIAAAGQKASKVVPFYFATDDELRALVASASTTARTAASQSVQVGAEDRLDAIRYRWLRETLSTRRNYQMITGAAFDAAIDYDMRRDEVSREEVK